jgi:isopentenyl-diphosphate delta-isomerase
VTRDELREMMDPKSGLRWSPWFRIIADKFLDTWWGDLENCLNTEKHVDLETVHEVM